MTTNRVFVLDRVGVPTGLHDIEDDYARAAFGEQAEWGFAIPWIYQALADPAGNRPMLQAPQRGEDFWPGALAYWSSLFHLLIFGFGWSRPDRGLRWWYDAGKPTDDPKLALLNEVWNADGQLDWFAAWLWTGQVCRYLGKATDVAEDTGIMIDPAWLDQVERTIETFGAPSPYGGGYDPLHLTAHIHGPMEEIQSVLRCSAPNEAGHVVLSLDSMTGWYRALVDSIDMASGATGMPISVEVTVETVGSLGTFRLSRETGLWYSGRHFHHIVGN